MDQRSPTSVYSAHNFPLNVLSWNPCALMLEGIRNYSKCGHGDAMLPVSVYIDLAIPASCITFCCTSLRLQRWVNMIARDCAIIQACTRARVISCHNHIGLLKGNPPHTHGSCHRSTFTARCVPCPPNSQALDIMDLVRSCCL